MDRAAAIAKIKEACKGIAVDLMKLNPAIGALNDKPTQDELYETVYRITKDVEIIKKRVIKLETAQDTPEL
jgi:hypothetical protein